MSFRSTNRTRSFAKLDLCFFIRFIFFSSVKFSFFLSLSEKVGFMVWIYTQRIFAQIEYSLFLECSIRRNCISHRAIIVDTGHDHQLIGCFGEANYIRVKMKNKFVRSAYVYSSLINFKCNCWHKSAVYVRSKYVRIVAALIQTICSNLKKHFWWHLITFISIKRNRCVAMTEKYDEKLLFEFYLKRELDRWPGESSLCAAIHI